MSSSNSQYGQVWTKLPSNIIIPTGTFHDHSISTGSIFADLSQKIEKIETVFSNANVSVRKDSDLGRLIHEARAFSEAKRMEKSDSLSYNMMFTAMHLDRIVNVVTLLASVDDKQQYLEALVSGTLDFFQRTRSHAKDIFWELEVWSRLLKSTSNVFLREPDVAIEYDDVCIGIACKKIYSEGHIQKVLSNAVKQIENNYEFGIAAFNIDDLLPGEAVLNLASLKDVLERLDRHNGEFLKKHDRHFRKYLSSGRLIAALISSSIISDTQRDRPRFQNVQQWTIWEMPGLPIECKKHRDRLYEIMLN